MFMQRLVLIDGNAILHRGFHALPPFTSPDGRLVNAVYGFFSMFLKIIQDFQPQYLVVCFDRPKPTFRKLLYVGYQAKRPKMSDDLVPQIAIVHEILEKAKIEIFEVDGYEADDLIGTIANQSQISKLKSQKEEIEVIIVSGDRDMLQLINPQVTAAMPITGITNMTVFDERKTEEKYQVKPSQIIDYKSLVGDPSDNYSGVPGIGPKTAVTLLKEFGSLENIYKNLDNIQKKNPNLALKLAEGGESAGLAKKLATIVTDAPITLDIEKCNMSHFDMVGIKEEFEKLSFKSLLKRLEVKKPDLPKEDEVEQLGLI